MTTYTNPTSLMTPVDFKLTGPAAGAMSAIRDAYAFSNLDAANRDSDLGYLSTLNKYENQMADNPLIQQKRENDLAQQQAEAEDWKSGINRELMTSGKELKQSANTAETAANKLKQSITGANTWVEAYHLLESLDGRNPLEVEGDPGFQSTWNELKNRAKAAGTPFPEGSPFNPRNRELFGAKTRSALDSLPELQRRQDIAEKAYYQGKYVVAPAAEQRAQTARENIEGRLEGIRLRGKQFASVEAAYAKVLDQKEPLDVGDLSILQVGAERDFDKTIQGKSPSELFYTAQNPQDPNHGTLMEAQARGINSPNEFYLFAKQKYVEGVLRDQIKKKGVKDSPTGNQPEQPTAPTRTSGGRTSSGKITDSATTYAVKPPIEEGKTSNASSDKQNKHQWYYQNPTQDVVEKSTGRVGKIINGQFIPNPNQ